MFIVNVDCLSLLTNTLFHLQLWHLISNKQAKTLLAVQHKINESTAGADASMEVSKLYNIKLLKVLAIRH